MLDEMYPRPRPLTELEEIQLGYSTRSRQRKNAGLAHRWFRIYSDPFSYAHLMQTGQEAATSLPRCECLCGRGMPSFLVMAA